jgi:hypothetical protein
LVREIEPVLYQKRSNFTDFWVPEPQIRLLWGFLASSRHVRGQKLTWNAE